MPETVSPRFRGARLGVVASAPGYALAVAGLLLLCGHMARPLPSDQPIFGFVLFAVGSVMVANDISRRLQARRLLLPPQNDQRA